MSNNRKNFCTYIFYNIHINVIEISTIFSFCISVKVVGNKNNDSLVFSFIVEYIDSLLGSLIICLAKFGPILLK